MRGAVGKLGIVVQPVEAVRLKGRLASAVCWTEENCSGCISLA
jgi:hypothetical protein